jgi:hypothetical protein
VASPGVVGVWEAEVAGVVAEVVDPLRQAGQRDPALQELPGRHAGRGAGGGPGLLGQEVEGADETLRLCRREAGAAGQLEGVRRGGGEAEQDEDAGGCHWRCCSSFCFARDCWSGFVLGFIASNRNGLPSFQALLGSRE